LFRCEIKPSPRRSWNQPGIKLEAKVLIMVELVSPQIVCQANAKVLIMVELVGPQIVCQANAKVLIMVELVGPQIFCQANLT
jgi:hypothetical protein